MTADFIPTTNSTGHGPFVTSDQWMCGCLRARSTVDSHDMEKIPTRARGHTGIHNFAWHSHDSHMPWRVVEQMG
ncbi:unnamed protein product [Strongylus vulgaris]|uniref:Uncharacterized protein n=1 Tax=Strongylus vulgaris TaxID=40348 RepID=A0A3P7KTX0_STRVU|nr:unnamed protein product [Strongylus vulgaris]